MIISHVKDSSELPGLVLGHPLLESVRPALSQPVAVVGGVVRDAAIGAGPGSDVDLVVEGPARDVAEAIGRHLGCRVTHHQRFLTASVELPDGSHLDVVTARRERYSEPGALPQVSTGTLADDLARRDFTVNAMAVLVRPDGDAELLDPHGGMADLDARCLRALCDDAFVEDPSRVVRAARYAGRLGLVLEAVTEAGVRRAAPNLDPGSARVGEELRRLLIDSGASDAVGLLGTWGVPWLPAREPAALADEFDALGDALAREGAPPIEEWPLRLGLAVAEHRLESLALPGWARGLAADARRGPALARSVLDADRRSEVDRLLRRAPAAAEVSAVAHGAEPVADWWRAGRDLTLEISGADLVEAGVPPGPAIGRALDRVRADVLDGTARDRAEQLAIAVRAAAESR